VASSRLIMADDVELKLAVHEAICAERYKGISDRLENGKERMQRIEIVLYVLIVAVLLGPGVAAEVLKHLVGM
jgi:glycerol-3-phosphate dehydrogenase